MGDLKTNWTDPALPTHEPGGQGVLSSGSDPNADGGDGAAGLQKVWPDPVVPVHSGAESPNSVSSLPALPNRWVPSETPPEPPSLTDRNPGTIDKK